MAYVKPNQKQIENAIECGWSMEAAERGYEIFDFDGLGLLEVEAIGDVYFDTDEGYDDEACAHEAERSGYCKIIPVDELPDPFTIEGISRRWFGWVDTPENRKAIWDYCNKTAI